MRYLIQKSDFKGKYFPLNSMKTNIIVWLDLETTGLNPSSDYILEVGIIITDWELKELKRKNWIIFQPECHLEMMNEYVRSMHQGNGLLNFIKTGFPQEQVETEIIQMLCSYGKEKLIMAGNSINFDKSFLQVHMPRLSELFSHQIIDATSFLLVFNAWNSDVQASIKFSKTNRHRALDDLDRCLTSMRAYKHQIESHL